MRIDHVGVVVRDISKHFDQYMGHFFQPDWLGPFIYDPLQKVNVAFIDAPGGRIELIEPAAPDSPVSSFAEKSPAGYHHICLEVEDLDKQLVVCRENRQFIISQPKPAVAFGGRRIAFVQGRDKLLWELLEAE